MQTTKASRTISPECSDTENAQLDFELSQPVKPRIGKVAGAKAHASKAKSKEVQGITESLADPDREYIDTCDCLKTPYSSGHKHRC